MKFRDGSQTATDFAVFFLFKNRWQNQRNGSISSFRNKKNKIIEVNLVRIIIEFFSLFLIFLLLRDVDTIFWHREFS